MCGGNVLGKQIDEADIDWGGLRVVQIPRVRNEIGHPNSRPRAADLGSLPSESSGMAEQIDEADIDWGGLRVVQISRVSEKWDRTPELGYLLWTQLAYFAM